MMSCLSFFLVTFISCDFCVNNPQCMTCKCSSFNFLSIDLYYTKLVAKFAININYRASMKQQKARSSFCTGEDGK